MRLPPHLAALAALRRSRVEFLVIGAMALGHYSPEAAAMYVTGDCDILVRPTRANLGRALRILKKLRYALSVNDEPLLRVDALILRRFLEHRVTVRAEKDDSLPFDVLVSAIGYTFDQWWKGRRYFRAGAALIPCGSLDQVLQSKREAGRDKDKKLLALYQATLKSHKKY